MSRPHPTRILFMIDDLGVGGTERMLLTVLKHIDRARFAPDVLTLFADGPIATQISALGVRVRCLRLRKWNLPLKFLQLAFLIVWGGFDILQTAREAATVMGTIVGRLCGVSLVTLRWESEPSGHGHRMRGIRHLAAVLAHHLQACSTAVAHDARRFFRLGSRPIEVICNAVEPWDVDALPNATEVRKQLGVPKDVLVVGTVANLNWRKDYGTLIRASKLVVQEWPRALFLSVGAGEDREVLVGLVQELGLASHWRFLGRRDDVRHLLRGLDVFSLSSVREGFGVVLIEAMWSALPCVATAVGGIREIVSDGETGFLVPARDPRALADRILALARNPEKRRQFGLAGKARVCQHFLIGAALRRLEHLYATRGRMPHE